MVTVASCGPPQWPLGAREGSPAASLRRKGLEQDSICSVQRAGQPSQSEVDAFGVSCPPPQSSFIPAFPTDHSHLGGGAAGMCAERGGPQPGLETLAGGRDIVSGELGEGRGGGTDGCIWERGLQLACSPLPKPSKSTALHPPPPPGSKEGNQGRKTEALGQVERGDVGWPR